MTFSPFRLGVLLSGGGTTLQNLIDYIVDGRLRAQIAVVISNNVDAYGVERAKKAGIPTIILRRKDCQDRQEFSQRIFDVLRESEVHLVCMAGFLQLIEIPEDFTNQVMNIHPSLIPSFCGRGFHGQVIHEAVLARGVKISGCTVHFADNEYDHGPIILQKSVPVLDDDTPDTLASRVFEAECEAYPEAIQLFGDERLIIEGQRVSIRANE